MALSIPHVDMLGKRVLPAFPHKSVESPFLAFHIIKCSSIFSISQCKMQNKEAFWYSVLLFFTCFWGNRGNSSEKFVLALLLHLQNAFFGQRIFQELVFRLFGARLVL